MDRCPRSWGIYLKQSNAPHSPCQTESVPREAPGGHGGTAPLPLSRTAAWGVLDEVQGAVRDPSVGAGAPSGPEPWPPAGVPRSWPPSSPLAHQGPLRPAGSCGFQSWASPGLASSLPARLSAEDEGHLVDVS
ncbi:hypothetical protein H1C71_012080 [Ictidomys tridecemlineatus]|nr:hypothetical protein H1C71_012080 [Ictidomys tridecemlineatus]